MPDGPTDEIREPSAKTRLAEPVPGLTKRARGRHVPTKESSVGTDRKFCCPVEECQKMFKKRDHLHRHIKCLHQHEQMWVCHRPECDKAFTRYDNYKRHTHIHSHWQEIIACSPEDEYKGVHIPNPHVIDPDCLDIKPFKNIGIHPIALGLWRFQEGRRRKGFYVPKSDDTDCERYFRAHPEEREAAFRGEGEWEWRNPPHGPEFVPYNESRPDCITGSFKVNIQKDST
ncbi:hypothetical protein L226DRAFT_451316 [Lentinus tigrinus ALCF2SS1-7]|uniref:C2H2-type domain-containing protein n=1 Tax=Lentinus tigrinus ALCF2SS1-6 TaxID=1328759 RepID=A0A5C2SLR0_9APHY|nr:hypothetical protein L227DRAFT_494875 [Lentinus tigrinus ALCF2SS1-6]RPD82774.1 hypothetical protein L226DRAFT_451316 [Lentinus tigrinus ALCF2SS1-7]